MRAAEEWRAIHVCMRGWLCGGECGALVGSSDGGGALGHLEAMLVSGAAATAELRRQQSNERLPAEV